MKLKDTDKTGCGKCNLCCKIMAVADLNKEAYQWCAKVVKNGGCSCYNSRPNSCREYNCLWLLSLQTEKPLPIELKPINCGALLNMTSDQETVVMMVNEGTDWQKGYLAGAILEMSKVNPIIIRTRNRFTYIKNCQILIDKSEPIVKAIEHIEVPE